MRSGRQRFSRSGRTALVSPAARFKTGRSTRRFAGRSPQWIQIVQKKSNFDAAESSASTDALRGGHFAAEFERFGIAGRSEQEPALR
jgi:hypothetical protein